MKKLSTPLSLLLVSAIIYWSYYALMPRDYSRSDAEKSQFSTERALEHVKVMSEKEHFVGAPAHEEVRNYIIGQLQALGLETSTQEGYTSGDWGNLSKPINILSKIEGSGNGKALMLLSHYDSNPHSSLGASDAGSGVATILEAVRAFLSKGEQPKNDIIILISDAEELGLNGAQLFVNEHPWAKNVGLVLNFEARGSGGPSYMLIETNGGNKELIKAFSDAGPQYPVANSLAYSIYKMLPNDTDLTVFREDGDIEGFNFAFIDDHFDYHTVKDNYERLDRNTLEHQGSYMMPLLSYFSNADLSSLKSDEDYVYFNVPVFKLVFYPFSWILPMLIIAVVLFLFLIGYGLRNQRLMLSEVFRGFVPFLTSLIICGLIGYFSWSLLTSLYPQYRDMLHGFTYNGHLYIATFATLSIAITFWIYSRFKKMKTADLMVAPLTIWLIICALVAFYLQGASFFIIPGLATLIAFYVLLKQEKPSILLLVLMILPGLWILSPFIQMFPVGLGLKMMVAATVFTVLIFGLSLPVFGFYKRKKRIAWIALLFAIAFFIGAHLKSGFNSENAKPNSLLYVLNADENKAMWATYDTYLDNWVEQYIGEEKKDPKELVTETFSSKYGTGFSYVSETSVKNIPGPEIQLSKDTLIGDKRFLQVCIRHQRPVNRLEVFTNQEAQLESCSVNGVSLPEAFLQNPRRRGKLVAHYISNNSYTEIDMVIKKGSPLELDIYESSNDLLKNPLFSIPKRPENTIPMPFVLNDAIIVKKSFKVE
ncbi:M20/M25/M40 family metallo-hydrolase [Leptobacterium flavescens]|uniref:Vacuolar membrane protease n=1 Tax=Leptobacterium flavescens TaxID=472055 RepID=A0A6P0UI49_9FLAO|nr:M20/M25/M40 family metallo-hydrolase [Leptobacterium flavescens]NER12965.1 M20/M25/M40 family metallo-hydrolase [Leptobacterium flavescens]